jgi:hypothetical protein
MTLDRRTPEAVPVGRESKWTLLGTALMLGMGALVIGSALVLILATIALGDTAFELP